jgi:hypothetical protein
MTETSPRRFYLHRTRDITGASGTGRVADGVLWPDGSATVRWRGEDASVAHWDRMESAEHRHGHNGATMLVWLDEPGSASTPCAGSVRPVDVLVQGAVTHVLAHEELPLGSVLAPALHRAGATHHPLDRWELRGDPGELLDVTVPLGDYGFPAGARPRLHLNLRAGVGG